MLVCFRDHNLFVHAHWMSTWQTNAGCKEDSSQELCGEFCLQTHQPTNNTYEVNIRTQAIETRFVFNQANHYLMRVEGQPERSSIRSL